MKSNIAAALAVSLLFYTAVQADARELVTIPSGTSLKVRMVNGVDSSKDAAGTRFTGTLEANLSVNGITLAPAGTTVYGQIAQVHPGGRLAGPSVLSVVLTDIVIDGEVKQVTTNPVTMIGQGEGRQTIRRAGGAAAVGGIVGGGEGTRKGAEIGTATYAIPREAAASMAPGSLVEFRLNQPLTIQTP